jgi:excisionase family DNA binding protein
MSSSAPFLGGNAMPEQEVQAALNAQHEEVLTLAEAAAYLRVREADLEELLTQDAIPVQKIGGEWRFLKHGLADWLRHGRYFYREFRGLAVPWLFEFPPTEELLLILEKRLLGKLAQTEDKPAKPGSKEAVRKNFGVWWDDPTVEAQLTDIYRRRRGDPECEQ